MQLVGTVLVCISAAGRISTTDICASGRATAAGVCAADICVTNICITAGMGAIAGSRAIMHTGSASVACAVTAAFSMTIALKAKGL